MKSMVLALIGSVALAASGTKGIAENVAVTTNPLHCVHVTEPSGRLINGCYDVSKFVNINGAIWAVCKLKGTLDGVDLDEDCEVPVTIQPCEGNPRLNQ